MDKARGKNLFVTLSFCIISIGMSAQDSDLIWNFPIVPGMIEWKDLANSKEKIESCQIPENVLLNLSDEQIIELCLRYPLLLDILAFNNVVDGINKFAMDFNGFQELIKRPNGAEVLVKLYENEDPLLIDAETSSFKEKFDYAFRISMMELFLCHKQLLSNLDQIEKKALINQFHLKKTQKNSSNEIYRELGLQSICLAIIVFLESEDVDLNQSVDMDIVNPYIYNGILISPKVFTEIDKAMDNYLGKN